MLHWLRKSLRKEAFLCSGSASRLRGLPSAGCVIQPVLACTVLTASGATLSRPGSPLRTGDATTALFAGDDYRQLL